MVSFRRSELDDVEKEARELLKTRAGEIRDGKLDGKHWFVALLGEARDRSRRRRTWAGRREE